MLSVNAIVLGFISCTPQQKDSGETSPFTLEEQAHLNYMLIQPSQPIEADDTNMYRNNPDAISFGELLFSATDLSKNGSHECAWI